MSQISNADLMDLSHASTDLSFEIGGQKGDGIKLSQHGQHLREQKRAYQHSYYQSANNSQTHRIHSNHTHRNQNNPPLQPTAEAYSQLRTVGSMHYDFTSHSSQDASQTAIHRYRKAIRKELLKRMTHEKRMGNDGGQSNYDGSQQYSSYGQSFNGVVKQSHQNQMIQPLSHNSQQRNGIDFLYPPLGVMKPSLAICESIHQQPYRRVRMRKLQNNRMINSMHKPHPYESNNIPDSYIPETQQTFDTPNNPSANQPPIYLCPQISVPLSLYEQNILPNLPINIKTLIQSYWDTERPSRNHLNVLKLIGKYVGVGSILEIDGLRSNMNQLERNNYPQNYNHQKGSSKNSNQLASSIKHIIEEIFIPQLLSLANLHDPYTDTVLTIIIQSVLLFINNNSYRVKISLSQVNQLNLLHSQPYSIQLSSIMCSLELFYNQIVMNGRLRTDIGVSLMVMEAVWNVALRFGDKISSKGANGVRSTQTNICQTYLTNNNPLPLDCTYSPTHLFHWLTQFYFLTTSILPQYDRLPQQACALDLMIVIGQLLLDMEAITDTVLVGVINWGCNTAIDWFGELESGGKCQNESNTNNVSVRNGNIPNQMNKSHHSSTQLTFLNSLLLLVESKLLSAQFLTLQTLMPSLIITILLHNGNSQSSVIQQCQLRCLQILQYLRNSIKGTEIPLQVSNHPNPFQSPQEQLDPIDPTNQLRIRFWGDMTNVGRLFWKYQVQREIYKRKYSHFNQNN